MMQQKRWLGVALGVFVATAVLAIVVNSLREGWHWEYSISRYVGMRSWSAVVFALGNVFVAGALGSYLFRFGERRGMPRGYFYLALALAVMLIGLSVWPLGYFDQFVDGKSAQTCLHEFCSRTMFACMALIAVMIGANRRMETAVRWGCGVFVLYGLACAVGYLGRVAWFMDYLLVFEAVYVLGFMLLCLGLRWNGEADSKSRCVASRGKKVI